MATIERYPDLVGCFYRVIRPSREGWGDLPVNSTVEITAYDAGTHAFMLNCSHTGGLARELTISAVSVVSQIDYKNPISPPDEEPDALLPSWML